MQTKQRFIKLAQLIRVGVRADLLLVLVDQIDVVFGRARYGLVQVLVVVGVVHFLLNSS